MREVDPRVSTVTAWHEATKKNPYFALEVPWKAAPRGLMAELEAMIESVHASRTPATAEELTGVLAAGAKQGERRGFGKIQEELF